MDYQIRKAKASDLTRIEQIYAYARQQMRLNGNPNQWGKTDPPHVQLVEDIAREELYVIADGDSIRGVFFFRIGEDPTYAVIEDGFWRSDSPYGTIHRIASDGSGGILKAAVSFCGDRIPHLRIDTHHDNRIMRNAVVRYGFERRGIIYVADGSPRIAYDRISL